MRGRLLAAVAGLVVLALPGSAGAASGDLYWANLAGQGGGGTIGHAKLDGTHADESYIKSFDVPCGVAVDNKHVYWADASNAIVNRAKRKRHAKPNYGFLRRASSPCGVAVTDKKVFATNQGDPVGVVRGPIGGGSFSLFASELFDSTSDCGVAVKGNDAFWVTNYDGDTGHGYILERAPVDHPGIGEAVATVPGYTACGVAVAGKFAYMANEENGAIDRVSIKAQQPAAQQLVIDLGAPCGVAVSGNHIYWGDVELNSIGRADLDGGNVKRHFIDGASEPCGVAVASR
jgi:DNA-binding beta-propeller fold protein YncE